MNPESIKLDILAFAAHPDDIELSCSGTIMKHIAEGKKVGIVDLTQGNWVRVAQLKRAMQKQKKRLR